MCPRAANNRSSAGAIRLYNRHCARFAKWVQASAWRACLPHGRMAWGCATTGTRQASRDDAQAEKSSFRKTAGQEPCRTCRSLPRVYRWCPSPIPRNKAFWRRAPTVRFVNLEILITGVLAFECVLSSLTSVFVHSRRTCSLVLLRIQLVSS
jgi:hypothetical protein